MKESVEKTFNQFKIHTQYSICEGAVKIEQLKDFCKKNKIKSLGLSDTYNLSGALEFSENLSSVGTQPIIGCVPTDDKLSENSRAPDKLKVSDKPNDLTLFFLQNSFK